MSRWKIGTFYHGLTRIGFINVDTINPIINEIPQEIRYNLGKNVGTGARFRISHNYEIDVDKPSSSNQIVDLMNKIAGWGRFL